ncbi:MAG: ABC transporter permease [Opitutales bacterium]|nr:ABC transporter permease [Opitutales bacterium]
MLLEETGKSAIRGVDALGRVTLLFVQSTGLFLFRHFSLSRLTERIYEIGVRTLPLILLVGFFTGMVLGLQGYYTLVRFGSEGLLGPAIALTLIRELGPVLTAIMVVGQAGSSMAAELGIQRNSEQVDALEIMGIETRAFLIGPRLVAAVICFPILTAFFDIIGILGGYVTGVTLLGLHGGLYWANIYNAVGWNDVSGGFVKALVFGVLVVLICCYQGYNTHRQTAAFGARAVSNSATRAVVISCVAILASDYIITSFTI